MLERIEFYKNRDIGERFSAAIDFLKQNWKVLYKNILLGGLPLAIISGILMTWQTHYMSTTYDIVNTSLLYIPSSIVSFITMVYIYSMTGAVLLHYDRNQLTESTGWSDLKGTFSRFAGKTTLISLIVYMPVIIIAAIFAVFFIAFLESASDGGMALSLFLFIIFFLGVFIAFAPSLVMLYFPSYFSEKTIGESIRTSFTLGVKNWGSLFVAIILTGIIFTIVYMVFSVPYAVVSMFSPRVNTITYILATLSTMGILLTYPIMFLIFAFQYFSIVEREEGVSLQSQMSEFENL